MTDDQLHDSEVASAGHGLGQLVGKWFEEYFVLPLLTRVANQLQLFLDAPTIERTSRGRKILWQDVYGGFVDYDFVLELGGTLDSRGIPVAFIESFWRRGSRHSRDKIRDDSGKLLPMRDKYPTARFLGVIAAGELTLPAKTMLHDRNIDLFYVSKEKVLNAFKVNGLTIDYLDTVSEREKEELLLDFERAFTSSKKQQVASTLLDLIGQASVNSYVDRVRAKLSALPQELRIIVRHESNPLRFQSIESVSQFLTNPKFIVTNNREEYIYQITYSDGEEFSRIVDTMNGLKELHQQIQLLQSHITQLSNSTT